MFPNPNNNAFATPGANQRFNSWIKNAWNRATAPGGNPYGVQPRTNPYATQGMQSTIPGYPYSGYQVQTGDTFESIATANGMTVQDIQQANNNMLVPPPAGRNINIPLNFGVPGTPAANVHNTTQPQTVGGQYVGQGTYLPGQQPTSPGQPPATGASNLPQRGGKDDYFFRYSTAMTPEQVTEQLTSGLKPPAISVAAAQKLVLQNGEKLTDAELQKMGYTFNPATGAYMLGSQGTTGPTGAGPAGATGPAGNSDFMNTGFMQQYTAAGTSFYQQKRWDPDRKKFVLIGQLMREGKLDKKGKWHGRKRGGGEETPAPAPVAATNAGTSPGQQLNQNQAGG